MKDFKTYFEDFNNWRAPGIGAGGPNIIGIGSTGATPCGFKGALGGSETVQVDIPKKNRRKKKKKLIIKRRQRFVESTNPSVGVTKYELGIWKSVMNNGNIIFTNINPGMWERTMSKHRHRLNGPAVIYSSIQCPRFFINGIEYDEKEYWKQPEVVIRMKIEKLDPKDQNDALNILDI